MIARRAIAWLLIAGFVLSGCQTTSLGTREHLWTESTDRRVVLMPTDIELSVLNAGGVQEPNAAWTEKAKQLAFASLQEKLGETSASLVNYDEKVASNDPESDEVQLLKLHEVVGSTIVLHKYLPIHSLPTKKDSFDWTLGPTVTSLRDKHKADYGLFVHIRDSYTSGGRAAVILLAAVLGVGVQGGTQAGLASLVDLKTGEIVWFNLLARGHGDLRTETGAKDTIAALLSNFPK